MNTHRDGQVNAPTTDSRSDVQTDASTLTGPPSGIANDPTDLWDALGTKRRRQTVRYLAANDDVDIGEISEHIAGIENDCPPDQLDGDQRTRVYIAMMQNHLPVLNEGDIVAWDKPRGAVERGDEFVTARCAVEAVAEIGAGKCRDERESPGLLGRLRSLLGWFR